jgi:hypothetical protein
LAADIGGYLAGLTLYRLGDHQSWVRWFAEAVSGAGRAQRLLVTRVELLRRQWRERLGSYGQQRSVRSDSTAWRILDLLPRHLVLTAEVVAAETGQSTRSANSALATLAGAGVLVRVNAESHRRGRPAIVYASEELLALAGSTPITR